MKTQKFPELRKRFMAVAVLFPLAGSLAACGSPGFAGAAIGGGAAAFAGGLITGRPDLAIAGGVVAAAAAGGLIAEGIAQQNRGAFNGASLNPPLDPRATYLPGQQPYYGHQEPHPSQRDFYTDRRGHYFDPRSRHHQPQLYIERERITVGPVDPYLAQRAGCFTEGWNRTGGANWRCPPHINPYSIQVLPGRRW